MKINKQKISLLFSVFFSCYLWAIPGADETSLKEMSSPQLIKLMGNGINLGNTMEAAGPWLGYGHAQVTDYEKAWGQPVTTKKMFEAMKTAGFDSVRIPVAWTHTMDWSRGKFTIRKDYLDRVAQVVDWALESDLFVIINDHWDYQWWGMFSHDEALAWKIYESIWNQVGERFKNYSLRLIFEGGNEEIGDRLNDVVDNKVDSRLDASIKYSSKGKLTENQCYALAEKINQKFVDIIRSQGNNNSKRFLLIPGYNTDIDKTCDSRFKMPSDKTNSVQKLIISVHYYKPETYCLVNDPKNSWGYMDSWPGYDSNFNTVSKQNNWFRKLNKFTEQGYGVIIGEYGVSTRKDGTKKPGMEAWMTRVLENCDKHNYCPMLWDCNTFFKKNGDILGFTDSDIAAVYLSK